MKKARYRKVPKDEEDEDEEYKKQKANRSEIINAKLHSLFWIFLSAFLIYFTDFISLLYSDKINR